MKPVARLKPRFVEFIPEELEDNVLYVAMEHGTVIHRCCCGCGNEVVTPLSPTDWQLAYDGRSITLHPSIGNWGFPCQSHYWIRESAVQWSERWSSVRIEASRATDARARGRYFAGLNAPSEASLSSPGAEITGRVKEGLWKRLRKLLRRV
jgi:hypothetical protein